MLLCVTVKRYIKFYRQPIALITCTIVIPPCDLIIPKLFLSRSIDNASAREMLGSSLGIGQESRNEGKGGIDRYASIAPRRTCNRIRAIRRARSITAEIYLGLRAFPLHKFSFASGSRATTNNNRANLTCRATGVEKRPSVASRDLNASARYALVALARSFRACIKNRARRAGQ